MTNGLGQPRAVRVVIVDDHPGYREQLARSLRENGIEVVDAVPTAELAISSVEATEPDVVLLDLHLPDVSGEEATRRLRANTNVLALSASADPDEVTHIIAAGAAGYLPKDRPVEEIISWVRAVAAGEMVISPRIARALLHQLPERQDPDDSSPALTVGELELLELFADGQGIEEAAETLGLQAGAVCTITAGILMKLQRP
jgi:DNA-binding NarL/FixJ family response regulator